MVVSAPYLLGNQKKRDYAAINRLPWAIVNNTYRRSWILQGKLKNRKYIS